MMTQSSVGALPLAVIITSDETVDTLIKALEMLKSILPNSAFYGNRLKGPEVFMSDNCSELREALHHVWSCSNLLLCVFHLLQQVAIAMKDRRGELLI